MTKYNVGDNVVFTRDMYPEKVGQRGVIVVDDGTTTAPYLVKLESGKLHWKYGAALKLYEKPKKSARITALETQVAELQAKVEALEKAVTYPNTARFERESAEVDGILADIKRKAKSPNEHRADVIKRAKAFVDELLSDKPVKRRIVFKVNAEKRTVVALFYSFDTHPATVEAKGIAKCDPDDVFNADIGKAIALARALGVDVPVEFVKAVQPTEVVVGMRVYYTRKYPNLLVVNGYSDVLGTQIRVGLAQGERILEDTDAVYE